MQLSQHNLERAASDHRPGVAQACVDYGFRAGTDSYGRCVSREIEARRYREAAAVPAASATYPAR
ncbi:hypothetical protein RSO01_87260 [Reyranella soli]|uniref:Uncharacterized protein n=2 Tax=Reyranella soli TaxID=1230389 RepID=A0A512NRH8_9HYPH|nr:hypothetical protein RSO01_87260 [Reyranella soli]